MTQIEKNLPCLCLVMIFFCKNLFASTAFNISSKSDRVSLSPFLEYFQEQGQRLSIEEAVLAGCKNRFRPVGKVNFGFADHPFWLKFSIKNPSSSSLKRLLEVGFPFLDIIEFYEPDGKGHFKLHRAGRALPFSQREIKHRNFLFHIEIPPGLSSYYIRIETESAMYFPMTLWEEHAFFEQDHEAQFALGLYYGIMLVMALYNLFIFLSLKDRAYLFYVLYIIAFALYQMTANGLAYEYLWPWAVWWNRKSTLVLASIAMIFALFFTRDFLSTPRAVPFLDRLLKAIFVLSACVSVLSLLLDYGMMLKVTLFVVAIFVILVLITGFVCWRRGQRSARFYLLAWFALLLGVMVLILWNAGLLPSSFFSIYSIQFGSVFDVVLLSLALADRINELRNAREDALRAVMAEREKAQEQREEMVRELHDGIGAIATNIRLLAEKARALGPTQEIDRDLATISELARKGRTEIGTFMDCLDDGEQEVQSLVNDMRFLGSQLLLSHGMAFSLEEGELPKDVTISPFVRLNCLKIFQEALTNVLRHAGASRVEAWVGIRGKKLILIVRDDGAGPSAKRKKGAGRGLSNMRKRAKRLGGSLEIKQENGTEIRFEIPIFKTDSDIAD